MEPQMTRVVGRAASPNELHAGLVVLGVEGVVGGYMDGHAVRVALGGGQLVAAAAAARH